MYFCLWIEIFRGFAVLDPIDLAIRRTCRVKDPAGIDRDSEDFRLVGSPDQLRRSVRFDAEDAAAVSRGCIERSIGSGYDTPHDGLFGSK